MMMNLSADREERRDDREERRKEFCLQLEMQHQQMQAQQNIMVMVMISVLGRSCAAPHNGVGEGGNIMHDRGNDNDAQNDAQN